MSMNRTTPTPFTTRQIELATTFGDQAVIAIENARLLNELRQRTDDLSESLERQTATSEVLGVISQSTSNLQPVVDTIAATAARLCRSDWAVIFKLEKDGKCHLVANNDANPDSIRYLKDNPISPNRNSATGRAVLEARTIHVHDVLADPEFTRRDSQAVGKQRTVLSVPLLREGAPIGVISLARTKVRPYTDKQIELVTAFADQAVIAIENVRLFEAEKRRTAELSESLQQQTATADVLKVISRSTFDLQTVLNTLAESAAQLCDAELANIWRPNDGVYRLAASSRSKVYLENKEYLEAVAIEPSRGTIVGRTLLDSKTVHVHDVQADPEHNVSVAINLLGGHRTVLGVPLQREGVPIGVIALIRSAVRPFTEKQIELVESFDDPAVIALENAT